MNFWNKKISAIFINSFGIGFALLMPMIFLSVVNIGILNGLSVKNPFVIFISHLMILFYLAWMGGVFTSENKEFNYITRGILSSVFVNTISITYFFKNLISPKHIHILCLIILLNCLFAIYGCQIGEKYRLEKIGKKEGGAGIFLVVALGAPVPFFAITWLLILAVLKLYSLS